MQFAITAYDGKDEGALERRMAVRPQHLENIARVKETGSVVCAGGITNEAGQLVGSVVVLDFDTKEQFDDYMESEPYIKAGVWQDITVNTVNVLIVNDEPYSQN